jgi:hypothetical protein
MAKKGLTIVTLADMVGLHWCSIQSYRMGRTFPSPGSSARVAAALRSPHLRTLGTWRVPCTVCGKPVEAISRGGHPKMYCSLLCRAKRRYDRDRASPGAKRAKAKVFRVNASLLRENRHLRDVIRDNCDRCAMGSGICPQDEGCAFIPVTELRKVTLLAATG